MWVRRTSLIVAIVVCFGGRALAEGKPSVVSISDAIGADFATAEESAGREVAAGVVSDRCGCGHPHSCSSCGRDGFLQIVEPGPTRGAFAISGWLEAGATASADSPVTRYVSPVAFNDRQEVQLNQLYASFGRDVNTRCQCFDIGGRVDLLFGTDARFVQATGLETRRDSSSKWNSATFYQLAMPQVYAEVGLGNLSVKVGHWYSPIGFEAVTAPDNFFYSHAYSEVYGQPFTHTGVLATYALNERTTTYTGIHNGWNSFDATTNRGALLTGFTWTSCNGRFALAAGLTSGQEINNQAVYSDRTMYSLVAAAALTDRLHYVLQHDMGWQVDDAAPGVDAEWYGLNQYLLYTINDCWKLGGRMEWFRDDDGTRVTGAAGSYYAATMGMNWQITDDFMIRPELRWDWFDGTGGRPFDNGTKDSQFTGAFDAVLLW